MELIDKGFNLSAGPQKLMDFISQPATAITMNHRELWLVMGNTRLKIPVECTQLCIKDLNG
jgi:hypothetical protein